MYATFHAAKAAEKEVTHMLDWIAILLTAMGKLFLVTGNINW